MEQTKTAELVVKALEFYADPESYRNRPLDEQRKLLSGKDPTVAMSRIGEAPHGTALSDIQMDGFGQRAREALATITRPTAPQGEAGPQALIAEEPWGWFHPIFGLIRDVNERAKRPNDSRFIPLYATPVSESAQPSRVAVKGNHDGIYIASKTIHADRWRKIAAIQPVSSTWIYEAGEGQTTDFHDLWQRCLTEAATSKALVAYREEGEVFKGGWVEIGAALANRVPVHAVGLEEFSIAKYRGITHHATMENALRAARKEPCRTVAVLTQPVETAPSPAPVVTDAMVEERVKEQLREWAMSPDFDSRDVTIKAIRLTIAAFTQLVETAASPAPVVTDAMVETFREELSLPGYGNGDVRRALEAALTSTEQGGV